jgi:hypothetical protein
MSDLLREEQRLYEIEQKKAKKGGWKHWLAIAAVYTGVVTFCKLVGLVISSNEGGAYLMGISLPFVTAYLMICKAWGLFLWKKEKISS